MPSPDQINGLDYDGQRNGFPRWNNHWIRGEISGLIWRSCISAACNPYVATSYSQRRDHDNIRKRVTVLVQGVDTTGADAPQF